MRRWSVAVRNLALSLFCHKEEETLSRALIRKQKKSLTGTELESRSQKRRILRSGTPFDSGVLFASILATTGFN